MFSIVHNSKKQKQKPRDIPNVHKQQKEQIDRGLVEYGILYNNEHK